jgi:hypothetical protein
MFNKLTSFKAQNEEGVYGKAAGMQTMQEHPQVNCEYSALRTQLL